MKLTALVLCILLLLCACAPAVPPPQPTAQPTATPQPTPAPEEAEGSGKTVYTDWSKLEERETLPELIASRRYEEYTGQLIPRADYGPLIPYAGQRLMDDWPAETGCLYGLMTADGTVVTDPVYSGVEAPAGFGADGRAYVHPLLILAGWDAAGEEDGDPTAYAVAARDGSRCTPLAYRAVIYGEELLLLFGQDSMSVMSPEGEITRVWTVEEMGITQEELDAMLRDVYWHEGVAGDLKGRRLALGWDYESPAGDFGFHSVRYFDLDSGEIMSCTYEEWSGLAAIPEWDNTGKAAAVPGSEWMGDALLGREAPGLLCLREYGPEGVSHRYWLEDGTPLPQLSNRGEWYRQVRMVGGLIEDLDRNTASYYVPETMECILRVYLNYETD